MFSKAEIYAHIHTDTHSYLNSWHTRVSEQRARERESRRYCARAQLRSCRCRLFWQRSLAFLFSSVYWRASYGAVVSCRVVTVTVTVTRAFRFYSVCVRVLFYLKTFDAALAACDKCKWKFREPQRLQINWQHTRCILLTLCSPFKRPADAAAAAIVEVPSSLPYTRDPVPSPGAVATVAGVVVVVYPRLAACCLCLRLRLGSPRGSAPK